MVGYVSLRLPHNVTEKIDRLTGKYGYSSRADVTNDALRDLFEKYPETKTTTTTTPEASI
ncbi:MAG: ribbon-helix-helix domain-containing protein [Candidatus Bathyarchaeota archaeon]|nr:ribbon-helix-helix domain-containing protein [Candidatus Termiticorpusculum sp.]